MAQWHTHQFTHSCYVWCTQQSSRTFTDKKSQVYPQQSKHFLSKINEKAGLSTRHENPEAGKGKVTEMKKVCSESLAVLLDGPVEGWYSDSTKNSSKLYDLGNVFFFGAFTGSSFQINLYYEKTHLNSLPDLL